MLLCAHYKLDKDENKYISLVERYVGDRNPNKVHLYKCKRCGMKLHDIDVHNLKNKIDDMNNKLSMKDTNFPSKSDIYGMLAPVPGVYDEDSKYRDNQLS